MKELFSDPFLGTMTIFMGLLVIGAIALWISLWRQEKKDDEWRIKK